MPAVTFNGNYLVAGVNPAQSNGVFGFSASLDVPLWTGGRIRADIAEATAVLAQRRAEYNDTYGRIDFEVRNALLRLNAATQQVSVAENNRTLARETLQEAGDRFVAGIADTVEVVQAQESVAGAEQDYISAVYAHYLARLSLARATGDAEQGIVSLLRQTGP
jgi:outer membrane protein TolC